MSDDKQQTNLADMKAIEQANLAKKLDDAAREQMKRALLLLKLA